MPVVPFCLMDTLLRCSWMFLLKFVKQETNNMLNFS
uniref:Uncharacterized protein n=1 Tax=Cucumis melo TaxID=3656 RepID=A0A9I9EH55_CUCME